MKAVWPLAAVAFIASTSTAQRGADYGRPLETPENRADFALRGAARCVFVDVPTSARKVLETEIGSADEAKRVKGLAGVSRRCFQPQWPAFQPTAFREALAEASYREQFYRDDPTPAETTPPASFGVVAVDAKGTPEQEAAWQLAALGNCVVFASPAAAREWVIGPRNVEEETRRFALLKPGIAQCGGPAAVATLTARNFRGAVANALFERARRAGRAR